MITLGIFGFIGWTVLMFALGYLIGLGMGIGKRVRK